jgi:phosphatidylinositol alpha-1,6-mannosyltransferase
VTTKRVLVITRNFAPLWGGMERLNGHLVHELSQRFKVDLIAPKGAVNHVPVGVNVHEVALRPLSNFLLGAGWRSLRQIFSKYDVVVAGSGLTAPLALLVARFTRAKAVAYVHGLDLAVPHPLYRAIWLPAIRHLDRVIANSSATAALAMNIGASGDRIEVVHPGVTVPEAPDRGARERFRREHGLGDAPVLLSVGRLTARKGLREFVGEVMPSIAAHHPNLRLVVIGDVPADALYAEHQSVESIRESARAAGVADNIIFLGKRFGGELSDAYAAADVHVFPVRDIPNDPEGFGMVAIEAAAHGLATVAYATGGVTDAVADGRSGALVANGDSTGFATAVLDLIANPLPRNAPDEFASQFSWQRLGQQMAAVLEKI